MEVIDPVFFQAPEHRPKLSITEADDIPVIDLSPLSDPSSKTFEELVKKIGDACRDWGFFVVVNHGAPFESLEKIEAAGRKFFGLSKEEKLKVKRDAPHVMGYNDAEHTKNVKDWKEVFDYTMNEPTLMPTSMDPQDKEVNHWYNRWPKYPPELREAYQEYARHMEKLALKLMELIALSLGLPPKRFHEFFKDQTSWVRLSFYPACSSPGLVLGNGRHKDIGALTVLAQDHVGGLEVKRKSDGEWLRVKPTPRSYIINIGDIVQVWSNDAYEGVEHRVVLNPEKGRLSYAFFLLPAHYTMVQPLEELINEQNPAKYGPYNWGKFLLTRKHSNFRKLDVENILIDRFKIN